MRNITWNIFNMKISRFTVAHFSGTNSCTTHTGGISYYTTSAFPFGCFTSTQSLDPHTFAWASHNHPTIILQTCTALAGSQLHQPTTSGCRIQPLKCIPKKVRTYQLPTIAWSALPPYSCIASPAPESMNEALLCQTLRQAAKSWSQVHVLLHIVCMQHDHMIPRAAS